MTSKRKREMGAEEVGVAPAEELMEEDEDQEEVGTESDEEAELAQQQLEYENERSRRLEQNKKRMAELGLFDIVNSFASSRKIKKAAVKRPVVSGAPRRSTRLGGSRTNYTDFFDSRVKAEPKEMSSRRTLRLEMECGKPEIYTEEHEKLLGSYEKEWELFRDGCHREGGRIYDSANGKTCHQCRQKTLGQRTSCSSCQSKMGQFCGDCLFMRYGENVLEAQANKTWVCPRCRGICNCSLCRIKRGWAPTGNCYRHALAEGYKSVAHYLIMTHRGQPEPEGAQDPENQQATGNDRLEKLKLVDTGREGDEGDTESPFHPHTPSPPRSNPRSASRPEVVKVEETDWISDKVKSTSKRKLEQSMADVEKEQRSDKSRTGGTPSEVKVEIKTQEDTHPKVTPKSKQEVGYSNELRTQARTVMVECRGLQGTNPTPLTKTKVLLPGVSPEHPVVLDDAFYPTKCPSSKKSPADVQKEIAANAIPVCDLSDDSEESDQNEKKSARKLSGRTKNEIRSQRLSLKLTSCFSPSTIGLPCSSEHISRRLRRRESINYKSFL